MFLGWATALQRVEPRKFTCCFRCIGIWHMRLEEVTHSPLQGSKTEGELPWADMDAAVIAIKNGTKGLMRKSLTALPLYFWISEEEERAGAE